jgi:hypothetical protein
VQEPCPHGHKKPPGLGRARRVSKEVTDEEVLITDVFIGKKEENFKKK